MLRAVLHPGMADNLDMFVDYWETLEHQMHVNLAGSKQDEDGKISVVFRKAQPKLRDNLSVTSKQP